MTISKIIIATSVCLLALISNASSSCASDITDEQIIKLFAGGRVGFGIDYWPEAPDVIDPGYVECVLILSGTKGDKEMYSQRKCGDSFEAVFTDRERNPDGLNLDQFRAPEMAERVRRLADETDQKARQYFDDTLGPGELDRLINEPVDKD